MLAAALALLAGPALAGTGGPSREDIASEKAALFKQADANADGALSATEFETFRQLVRAKMAERHFARADADGDGSSPSPSSRPRGRTAVDAGTAARPLRVTPPAVAARRRHDAACRHVAPRWRTPMTPFCAASAR
jgi:hypothetical protein